MIKKELSEYEQKEVMGALEIEDLGIPKAALAVAIQQEKIYTAVLDALQEKYSHPDLNLSTISNSIISMAESYAGTDFEINMHEDKN